MKGFNRVSNKVKMTVVLAVMFSILMFIGISNNNTAIVTVNNKQVVFNDDLGYPRVVDGRTLVPIRVISEDMGFDVKWNNSLRTVTVTDNKNTIILTVGSNKALVNGKEVAVDVREDGSIADTKAVIIKERTYVPLRFISENMGAKVDWERKAGKLYVYITQEGFTPPVIDQPIEERKIEGVADYNNSKENIEKLHKFMGKDLDNEMSGPTQAFYNPLHQGTDGSFFYVLDRKEDGHNVEINIKNWYTPNNTWGDTTFEKEMKSISPTTKEVLRFYLPNGYDKVHKIIDDGFNNRLDDVNKYINKDISKMVGSDKKVMIVENFGVLRVQIGDGK